ncbi:MAG: hypothetical protein UHH95_04775 [Oscillospiraceae bacterium]|nr:hypothetical protein [Oscillospiraceae bacterium]
MKIKLFGKKVEPACLYCRHGRANGEGDRVFCSKKGIVSAVNSCRRFDYDPLKRVPKKAVLSTDLTEKDFEI